MKIVITGAAGFIGSTLAESLLLDNHDVYGVDCMSSYYNENQKQANIAKLTIYPSFHFFREDIVDIGSDLFHDAEVIFHLAGQPGVRNSWGINFHDYVRNNVETTQIVLECVKHSTFLKRLVFASTSSVYDTSIELPWKETSKPNPISPYGITKLTAENLCEVYSLTYHISVCCLRYFTVYGPRQRPDMAFHRFFRAGMRDEKIRVYGDGGQTRDFTFVDDVVRATRAAAFRDLDKGFSVFNIGSGCCVPLHHVIALMGEIMGKELCIEYGSDEKGDMKHTFADISQAVEILSYKPMTSLSDGLQAQYRWMRENEAVLTEPGHRSSS